MDSGVRFRLEVELGSMPFAFFKAVEETVAVALRQGVHGWQVTDCVVTMTHSGYWPRQSHAHAHFDKSMSSTAGDFRNLTPLVLMDALKQAGTGVYEPVHRFHLEIPADTYGPVLPALARLRAVPGAPVMRGSLCLLDGEIPAAQVRALEEQLPALTRGEGVLEASVRPLPAGPRGRPGAAADRPQPAQPRGIPAPGGAAGRRPLTQGIGTAPDAVDHGRWSRHCRRTAPVAGAAAPHRSCPCMGPARLRSPSPVSPRAAAPCWSSCPSTAPPRRWRCAASVRCARPGRGPG